MAESAKGLNCTLFQREYILIYLFFYLVFPFCPVSLSFKSVFLSLFDLRLFFLSLLFFYISAHSRSSFFVCLTIYVYLCLSQTHFARIGITLLDLFMHAFTRIAHFYALMCIHSRSNADANACTRVGDGNHVNFDEDRTYWQRKSRRVVRKDEEI